MDITEVTKAKHQLEYDLLSIIHSRVHEFTAITGICPDSISVDTSKFEAIGKGVECRVVGVRVGIAL